MKPLHVALLVGGLAAAGGAAWWFFGRKGGGSASAAATEGRSVAPEPVSEEQKRMATPGLLRGGRVKSRPNPARSDVTKGDIIDAAAKTAKGKLAAYFARGRVATS